MKRLVVLLLVAAAFAACDRVVDLTPNPDAGGPDGSMGAVDSGDDGGLGSDDGGGAGNDGGFDSGIAPDAGAGPDA